ncbi:CPCC family cysteine-rich protein [Luteolibacter arcticus]|uniref:CPCC family cysteine-rich protein n=1 Tax=Luteolibacter arcticus TaxID=1581411 RepID=A0ABT3GM25_9BACT|nr:DUF6714 family protein [Luteolibacter arcticus]MCW1924564.1 CPCC family cysteine-rich protein [Luteolibacter arcticus]
MQPDIRHPCPCCGYRSYALPAGGTMQLCPVCLWEDAPGDAPFNHSNEVSLVEGQRHFLTNGACEAQFEGETRAPLPEEARSPQWLSFDMLREKIITSIERAFRKVSRDGGITLHQMDLVDGNYLGTHIAMKIAEEEDPETRWQDIPAGKLSEFHESLVFLDDLGFRFYLPAFMTHALATAFPDIAYAEFNGVLWSLDGGPEDPYRRDSIALLNLEQKQATAAFLQLIATFADGSDAGYAKKGLRKGWDAFVPLYVTQATL